jgi:moderate conductance mechanosensitive channel
VALALTIVTIGLVATVAWLLVRASAERVARSILDRERGQAAALLPQVELERRVQTLQRIAVRTAGTVIALIAVLMSLSELSIDIGPAIAGLGVAGIAVGLGAQTLVRDWLAGIFIVLENQYSQGDVVRIAGVSGVVEDFSLRRTTLRDLDGTVHSVPNGQITVASNLTRVWARVNLDIPVAYDTDIERATRVIDEVGAKLYADPEWGPRLLEAPTVVRVGQFGDTGVSLKVLGQVRAAEQWSVAGELRKRVLAAFAEAGIKMPTAQRVVVATVDSPPPGDAPAMDPTKPAGPP